MKSIEQIEKHDLSFLPQGSTVRDVVQYLIDAYDVTELDRITDSIYKQLQHLDCPTRIHTAADNFGATSWYRFGIYTARARNLSISEFSAFAKEKFTSYCKDTGADPLLPEISHDQWDAINRLHLLYLTMSVVDQDKSRQEMGITWSLIRTIRMSKLSPIRLLSRLL